MILYSPLPGDSTGVTWHSNGAAAGLLAAAISGESKRAAVAAIRDATAKLASCTDGAWFLVPFVPDEDTSPVLMYYVSLENEGGGGGECQEGRLALQLAPAQNF